MDLFIYAVSKCEFSVSEAYFNVYTQPSAVSTAVAH